MKILYGVQGTGNGHITRARALSGHFKECGIEAHYLFSGRERQLYFDMEPFGAHWQCAKGLTFRHKAGKLDVLQTLQSAKFNTLIRDMKSLDLDAYDLVLTDFEPISAWAARRQKKTSIGIGHQYAFLYDVPKAGDSLIARNIMNHFAPTDFHLGLHWHHFGAPILPPIAETPNCSAAQLEPEKILVYFGFESTDDVIKLLEPFSKYTFVVYGPFEQFETLDNIQLKPFSREGFKHDLAICNGVICNAGFELASEAIQLGKKLLVKPLLGQMEQLSNALALEKLGLGMAMNRLDGLVVGKWLEDFEARRIRYPNVAREIVRWIAAGDWQNVADLQHRLWQETKFEHFDAEKIQVKAA